jgi:hypothetical protein
MGWMTLHSISVCYPESPNEGDRRILSEFMDAFAGTITCVHCRTHFASLFSNYKQNVPSWLNSRRDLFLAICRMHNNVNKRLDKPYPKNISECLSTLKNATAYTSPSAFRQKYIDYLFRDWTIHGRMTSYQRIALTHADKMRRINNEYFNHRETPYLDLHFQEDDVINYPNQGPVSTKIPIQKIKFKNIIWFPKK